MSTINLIPPQIKLAEKNKKIFSVVSITAVVLILMSAISLATLWLMDYYSANELAKSKESLAEEKAKVKNLEPIQQEVNDINARLQKIDALRKEQVLWSLVLTDLNHSTPEQLRTDTFAINTKDKKVNITGSAETRRDIVKLQTKLGTLSYLTNLVFSNSSYSENDGMYTFTMTGEFKK